MPKRDNPRTGPKYEKPERPAAKRRTSAKGAAPAAKGRPAAQGRTPVRAEENPNLLIGRNPISEAIKAGRPIDKILMQKDAEGSARVIAGLARDNGIPVQYVDKLVLDKLAPGKSHQGIAAYAAAHKYVGVEDILASAKARGEDPLVVVLDELEDPHNLGAILRSADPDAP